MLLIKGRSDVAAAPAEPRQPAARTRSRIRAIPASRRSAWATSSCKVEDASKRLTVAVTRQSRRIPSGDQRAGPGARHRSRRAGRSQSEVTLWAVDYGVLSLTAYRTPDVLGSVYVHKALQVMNTDSRQRIVSRRVLTPKGDSEGGGGGVDGSGMRKRLPRARVLAWLGRDRRQRRGDRRREAAGVADHVPHHGGGRRSRRRASASGEAEVRVNKPLTMKPTFPRFLAVGDKALFGAVVTSQLKEAGDATVTIRSLDPELLTFDGAAEQTLADRRRRCRRGPVCGGGEGGRPRPRADDRRASATKPTRSRTWFPVEVLASPETVAAYGQLGAEAKPRVGDPGDSRRAWCQASADCTSRCRPRRWSDWARARAISSSIPTAAPSRKDRARWRCCSRPISATPSRCPAWTRRRCGRRCSSR